MGKEGRWWKTKDKEAQRSVHMAGWRTTGDKEIGAEETRLWRVGQIFIKKNKPKKWQGDRVL